MKSKSLVVHSATRLIIEKCMAKRQLQAHCIPAVYPNFGWPWWQDAFTVFMMLYVGPGLVSISPACSNSRNFIQARFKFSKHRNFRENVEPKYRRKTRKFLPRIVEPQAATRWIIEKCMAKDWQLQAHYIYQSISKLRMALVERSLNPIIPGSLVFVMLNVGPGHGFNITSL